MGKSELLRALTEQLAGLAGDPATRVVGHPPTDPAKWYPTTIIDPRSGKPFTDAGAWDFVAEMLVGDNRVNIQSFDTPPNETAYTMNIPTTAGIIYIKVRMGKGRIIGRSFHYSDHQ